MVANDFKVKTMMTNVTPGSFSSSFQRNDDKKHLNIASSFEDVKRHNFFALFNEGGIFCLQWEFLMPDSGHVLRCRLVNIFKNYDASSKNHAGQYYQAF